MEGAREGHEPVANRARDRRHQLARPLDDRAEPRFETSFDILVLLSAWRGRRKKRRSGSDCQRLGAVLSAHLRFSRMDAHKQWLEDVAQVLRYVQCCGQWPPVEGVHGRTPGAGHGNLAGLERLRDVQDALVEVGAAGDCLHDGRCCPQSRDPSRLD